MTFAQIRNTLVGLLAGLGIVLVASLANADERLPIPDLHARITDLTQSLTAVQIATLDGELAALETRKGAQIAVLMVATLAPSADVPVQAEDIESYATRVFEQWKLGRKGVDDGVLLIVVKNDHKVRIEVGYGLEGAIPDAAAARIIREYIAPRFREGDYYGGIHAATNVLSGLIDGEPLPAPFENAGNSQATRITDDGPTTLAIVFASLMLGFVLAAALQNLLNFFPIRFISVMARRVVGLLAGPTIIAVVCYLAWGLHAPHMATSQLFIGAAVTSALGGYLVPQGASNVWNHGVTWSGFFDFKSWPGLILDFVLSGVTAGLLGGGSGGGGGGFSGGGGSSGGGGASGSW
jgi:uncharacterized protein